MFKKKVAAAVVAMMLVLGVHTIVEPASIAKAAIASIQKGKIVAEVNMRTGAGTKYPVIRTLEKSEIITITSNVNAYWYRIMDKNGKVGYVSTSSRYIKLISTSSSAPAPTLVPADTPKLAPTLAQNPSINETKIDAVIAMGLKYIGTPYVFGAGRSNDTAFDCSGFVSWIFNRNGVMLTKSSAKVQAKAGAFVPRDQLRKGDLIFSDTNKDGVINHVSLYIGEGKVLHTFRVGIGVVVSKFEGSTWDRNCVTARRIIQ